MASILRGALLYVIVPYAALTISLRVLAGFLPKSIGKYLKFGGIALAYIAGIIICATFGITTALVLTPFGKAGQTQYLTARAFKWLMWPFLGVWMEIDDEHNALQTRPAVYLGNHQTELDILFLGHIWPQWTSVTSKSSLKWYPILGQFMSLSYTVFIDRSNRQSALAVFAAAAQRIRETRQNVFIFPEGTRSYYNHPDLLPFKKGAFHLAIQAQVPIVPTVCGNYSHILNLKTLEFNSGVIAAKVLKPVPTTGLTAADVDDLMAKVRNDMVEAIKELESKKVVYNGSSTAPKLREQSRIAVPS